MINLIDGMTCFYQTIMVVRQSVTLDINNRPVYGLTTTFDIRAVAQPAKGADLQLVPEGERTEEVLKVHTTEKLLIGDLDNVLTPDVINFHGNNYKMVYRGDYIAYGFYKYLAVKLDAGS